MTPARKEPDQSTYSGRFAARLRMLRDKARLTQIESSIKLGISQNSLSSWETGTRQPPIDMYPKLASIYNLKHVRNLMPED